MTYVCVRCGQLHDDIRMPWTQYEPPCAPPAETSPLKRETQVPDPTPAEMRRES
jgi:hypothetical protein